MMLFDTASAERSFKKALDILEKHENIDLQCETLKNLAIAHLR